MRWPAFLLMLASQIEDDASRVKYAPILQEVGRRRHFVILNVYEGLNRFQSVPR